MSSSMFGVKALFLCGFYKDYYINNYNGKIEESDEVYTSFPKSINNLWVWILESRRAFENAPDTGILGKGIIRIFHLFLNYILRLLFLGTLLITFYPILIFLNIFICLCLIFCSPLLSLLWIIFDFLFCLIIYNRYDKLKKFPLFRIVIIEFLIGFIIQFISVILSILIQPLLSIIFFIYSQIHFILRFFSVIFNNLGKIPETNNCIAWVIKGPGLFRERYYDIKNKDILSLVIGELEKRILNNYKQKIKEILDTPNNAISNISKIYKKLGLSYNTDYKISESIKFYKDKLKDQIKERNFYPECHVSVKFTEERLEIVKNMVEIYVTEYSKKNDISFELDKFEEKKIENLSKEIMEEIFGINIFEPLENTDKIVQLKSVFKNDLDEITTKIFENPKFNDKIYEEKRLKESSIVRFPDFANFGQIFEGDLNLDLSHLKREEKKNLIKNEDLLLIKA